MKKILLIFMIMLFGITSVKADTLDLNTKGSIDITIKYNYEETIEGANIQLFKIASLVIDENSNIAYQYVEELSGEMFQLNELTGVISTDTEDEQAEKCIKAAKKIDFSGLTPVAELTTNSSGNVKFEDLELGLYLVNQSNKVKGYTVLDPYILTIPTVEEDEWVYDITSLPKPEIEKLADLIIKKVWNNNTNEKLPESITVDILNNGDLYESITLSSEDDWTLTLEDIPYSDSYSVEEKDIPNGYTVAYSQDGLFNFTIVNTNKLPQTGTYSFVPPLLITFGTAIVLTGFYLQKKENKNE